MIDLDSFISQYRYILLVDAGYFFKQSARCLIRNKNPDAGEVKITRAVIKTKNLPGMHELLINSARNALDAKRTSHKSGGGGVLWYDGVLRSKSGRCIWTRQHEDIKAIPGIYFRVGNVEYVESNEEKNHTTRGR